MSGFNWRLLLYERVGYISIRRGVKYIHVKTLSSQKDTSSQTASCRKFSCWKHRQGLVNPLQGLLIPFSLLLPGIREFLLEPVVAQHYQMHLKRKQNILWIFLCTTYHFIYVHESTLSHSSISWCSQAVFNIHCQMVVLCDPSNEWGRPLHTRKSCSFWTVDIIQYILKYTYKVVVFEEWIWLNKKVCNLW